MSGKRGGNFDQTGDRGRPQRPDDGRGEDEPDVPRRADAATMSRRPVQPLKTKRRTAMLAGGAAALPASRSPSPTKQLDKGKAPAMNFSFGAQVPANGAFSFGNGGTGPNNPFGSDGTGQNDLFGSGGTGQNLFGSGGTSNNSLFASGGTGQNNSLFASGGTSQNKDLFGSGGAGQNNSLFASGGTGQNNNLFGSGGTGQSNLFGSLGTGQNNSFGSGGTGQNNSFGSGGIGQNNSFGSGGTGQNNSFGGGGTGQNNPFGQLSAPSPPQFAPQATEPGEQRGFPGMSFLNPSSAQTPPTQQVAQPQQEQSTGPSQEELQEYELRLQKQQQEWDQKEQQQRELKQQEEEQAQRLKQEQLLQEEQRQQQEQQLAQQQQEAEQQREEEQQLHQQQLEQQRQLEQRQQEEQERQLEQHHEQQLQLEQQPQQQLQQGENDVEQLQLQYEQQIQQMQQQMQFALEQHQLQYEQQIRSEAEKEVARFAQEMRDHVEHRELQYEQQLQQARRDHGPNDPFVESTHDSTTDSAPSAVFPKLRKPLPSLFSSSSNSTPNYFATSGSANSILFSSNLSDTLRLPKLGDSIGRTNLKFTPYTNPETPFGFLPVQEGSSSTTPRGPPPQAPSSTENVNQTYLHYDTVKDAKENPSNASEDGASQSTPSFPKIPKAKVPSNWSVSAETPSSRPAVHFARMVTDLSNQYAVLNERYRAKLTSLPLTADWSALSLWHHTETTALAKRIVEVKKAQANEKGITGNESHLSTKRKAAEEPSRGDKAAWAFKRARGIVAGSTELSNSIPESDPHATATSNLFGNILSKGPIAESSDNKQKTVSDKNDNPFGNMMGRQPSSFDTPSETTSSKDSGKQPSNSLFQPSFFGTPVNSQDSSTESSKSAFQLPPSVAPTSAKDNSAKSLFGGSNTKPLFSGNNTKPLFGGLANFNDSSKELSKPASQTPSFDALSGTTNSNNSSKELSKSAFQVPSFGALSGTANTKDSNKELSKSTSQAPLFGTADSKDSNTKSLFGTSSTKSLFSGLANFKSTSEESSKSAFPVPSVGTVNSKDSTKEPSKSAFPVPSFGAPTNPKDSSKPTGFQVPAFGATTSSQNSNKSTSGFQMPTFGAPSSSQDSDKPAPASQMPAFGAPSGTQDSNKPASGFQMPAFGAPVTSNSPKGGSKTTSIKQMPSFGALGGAKDFMSQFKKVAKTEEELTAERKKKAQDEDYDSDEEAYEEWSAAWDEKEAARKAQDLQKSDAAAPASFTIKDLPKSSFTPTTSLSSKAGGTSGSSSPAHSTAGGLFVKPHSSTQTPSPNIFGHLSPGPSSNHQDESSDEEKEDHADDQSHTERATDGAASLTPSTNRKLGQSDSDDDESLEDTMKRNKQDTAGARPSLLSRMSRVDDVDVEKGDTLKENAGDNRESSVIEQSNGAQTPRSGPFQFFDFNAAGAKSATPKSVTFGGDQTFKAGTPIKFGGPATPKKDVPTFQFQGATPSSTPAGNPPSSIFSFLGNTPKPQPFLAVNANQSAIGSVPSSVFSSRAATPLSEAETSGKDSATELDDNDGAPQKQLDLTALTADEIAENDVIFVTEQALAKHQIDKGSGPVWETFARGPLRILKNKETGKAFVRMRISSGATPVNYTILPKLAAQILGSSKKMVLANRARDDGSIAKIFFAVKDTDVADQLLEVYNANI